MKFLLLHKEKNDFNKIHFFKTPIGIRFCIALFIIFLVYHFIYICLIIAITFALLANIFKFILLFYKNNTHKSIISQNIELVVQKSNFHDKLEVFDLKINDLKSYSILIPIYLENETTLKNLHNTIEKILYKPEFLSIFIICEEDDLKTIEVVKNIFIGDKYIQY